MKKIITVLLVAVMALTCVLTLCGCGQKNLDGTLEEILDTIYKDSNLGDDFQAFLQTQKITEENASWFLGKHIENVDAIASEPLIGSRPYSLCLIRVKEGADIDQVKKDIKDNLNTMKWVCVGIEKSELVIENIGDVVFVLISGNESDRKVLTDAFLGLAK